MTETSDAGAGIAMIRAERIRQIAGEGFDLAHDLQWSQGQLRRAASCYALSQGYRLMCNDDEHPVDWPWSADQWKPTEWLRDLAKAGALIAAEIDRIVAVRALRQGGDGG